MNSFGFTTQYSKSSSFTATPAQNRTVFPGWKDDGSLVFSYGSKHCLKRYLTLQIVVNSTPNTS